MKDTKNMTKSQDETKEDKYLADAYVDESITQDKFKTIQILEKLNIPEDFKFLIKEAFLSDIDQFMELLAPFVYVDKEKNI